MIEITTRQKFICRQFDVEFCPAHETDKLGLAIQTCKQLGPWHGLRHEPEVGTTGWFIWKGEYKEHESFFAPLHVSHIAEYGLELSDFLGLAPGWRFLLDGNHKDVWFDKSLLNFKGDEVSVQ